MNRLIFFGIILILLPGTRQAVAQPKPAALDAFQNYVSSVESRLNRQHRDEAGFLVPGRTPQPGELIIEQITPPAGTAVPGALLHHWRGTTFAPGATAADFERLLRDFNAYPQRFAPEVLSARTLASQGDFVQASLRVRQKHVITVVMDTAYDVNFGRLDTHARYSASRSTQIDEIDAPGTPHARRLSVADEHGFLWRLNTYWTYEERDGGLALQIETVSLSRAIPAGLGWALRPFVESVPRESLEFTLHSAVNALNQ